MRIALSALKRTIDYLGLSVADEEQIHEVLCSLARDRKFTLGYPFDAEGRSETLARDLDELRVALASGDESWAEIELLPTWRRLLHNTEVPSLATT